MSQQVSPAKILQIGSGFWASKVLLSAVEFEVFTKLAQKPMTVAQIEQACGWQARHSADFLDALLAMGFLQREGDGPDAAYSNAPDADAFLDKNKPTYMGGILEMFNARLYRYWGDLSEGLRSGEPQTEVKETGESVFATLYKNREGLEGFMNAMAGISLGNFSALAKKFDFSKYDTLCDVGGATGQLSILVAREHPNIRCTSFDLPPVVPIAQRHIEKAGLSDRITAVGGNFFEDALPKADVITMGMILHDWNLENKMHLIKLAYDALPEGGAFIVVENLIDDARRENLFGMLMSLNMLIEFGDAFDFTGADFRGWCEQVGFKRFDTLHLEGPASAGIAYK